MHIHSAVRKPTVQHLPRSNAAPVLVAQRSSLFLFSSKANPRRMTPCMSCTMIAHPHFPS